MKLFSELSLSPVLQTNLTKNGFYLVGTYNAGNAVRQSAMQILAAGLKNAIIAKDAPDDSTFDPEDVRTSTIRWITSNEPSFGAIGPSRVTNVKTRSVVATRRQAKAMRSVS